MDSSTINYSQSWEDPVVLRRALGIKPGDRILSITSGGCNTLALLIDDPQSIVAIDKNPAQNYLLELKVSALRHLSYEKCLEFLGVRESSQRVQMFQELASSLSPAASIWWRARPDMIRNGIINAGRFEKYIAFFRRWLLPLVHSNKKISELLAANTLDVQKQYYANNWDNLRWNVFFHLFFSRFLLNLFGRYPGSFSQTNIKSIALHFYKRAQYAMTEIPIQQNYFLQFMLTGSYGNGILPYYLEKSNFDIIRGRLDRITMVTRDLTEYLLMAKGDVFSKFNLSDVFEAMSESDTERTFGELVRVGQNGGAVVYWNNLVARSPSAALKQYLPNQSELAEACHAADRAFMYSDFFINTIRKPSGSAGI